LEETRSAASDIYGTSLAAANPLLRRPAVGNNAAMDENPYRSPQTVKPTVASEPPPLWRRVLSIPLLIFGVGYVLNAPIPHALYYLHHESFGGALYSFLMLAGGVALIWCGVRLRRV
jgi:hypothetical protein